MGRRVADWFRSRKRRHVHSYEPVSIRANIGWAHPDAVTVVSFRCTECPEREAITIDGAWTLEQVKRLHRGKDGRLYLPPIE